jgi:hypothetical protein
MYLKRALRELERRVADLEADLQPQLGKPGGVKHTTQRIDEALPDGSPKEIELIDTVNKGQGISNQDARIVYRFDDCNPALDGTTMVKGFCVSSHGQFRMDQRGITVRKIQEFFFNLEKYLERNETNRRTFDLRDSINRGWETKWTDERSNNLTVVFRLEGDSAKIITTYYKNKKDPILIEEKDYSRFIRPRGRRRRR